MTTTPRPQTARERYAEEQARTLRERTEKSDMPPSGPESVIQPSEAQDVTQNTQDGDGVCL